MTNANVQQSGFSENASISVQKKKTRPFVILDKGVLETVTISWKAKGLHCYLMSRPDGWKVLIRHLANQATDGRDSCYSGLKELEKAGLLQRIPIREKGRFIGLRTVVTETPYEPIESETDSPHTDYLGVDFPDAVRPGSVRPGAEMPDDLVSIDINKKRFKEGLSLEFKSNAHEASPEALSRNAKTAQDDLWSEESSEVTPENTATLVNPEIPATAPEPQTPSSAAPPFPAETTPEDVPVNVDAPKTSTFTQTPEKSAGASVKGSGATKVKAEVVETPSRAKNKGVSEDEFQAFVNCWNESRPKGDGECQAFSGLRVLSKRAKGQIERAVKEVGLEGALDALKYGLLSVQSDPYWSKKWQGKSPSFENLCSNEKLVAWFNEFESAKDGGLVPAPVAAQIQASQEARILEEQRQFHAWEDAQRAELRRQEELLQADLNAMGILVKHYLGNILEGRTPTQREFDHFIKRDDIQEGWQRWLIHHNNPKNRPTL